MKLLIYGSGEFGAVLKDLVPACGHEFAGFVDDIHAGEGILGGYDAVRRGHAHDQYGYVLAIGYRDLPARLGVLEKLKRDGYPLPPLLHPQAYVRDPGSIGAGSIVMARAIVDFSARIDEACVLWPGANVSHNSSVGRNCFLSPNSTVCGSVTLGHSCFIGAGAVVPNHRNLPAGTRVKAGQVYR